MYIHNISTKDTTTPSGATLGRVQQALAVDSAASAAEEIHDSEYLKLFNFEPILHHVSEELIMQLEALLLKREHIFYSMNMI